MKHKKLTLSGTLLASCNNNASSSSSGSSSLAQLDHALYTSEWQYEAIARAG